MGVIMGKPPGWALVGYGSGSGSGYGYGYGYVDGYGYGDGSGDGDGSGYGSGYVDGYGDGDGYSSLADMERCLPASTPIRIAMLKGACTEQVRLFKDTFPDGGTWPDDLDKAVRAGLQISWMTEKRGLLPLITEG